MSWLAHFDGACEPYNPGGWGGWGFAIWDPSGQEIACGHGVLDKGGGMTNNVAEYTAALECVRRWITLENAAPLLIRGDSKLVIEQMSGRWKAKAGAYVPVHHELRALVGASGLAITWEWVPRTDNARADDLSKQGLLDRGVTITVR
jgi:ribonuclease HI